MNDGYRGRDRSDVVIVWSAGKIRVIVEEGGADPVPVLDRLNEALHEVGIGPEDVVIEWRQPVP